MSALWNGLIMDPMVNALVLLYHFLGNNFVVALAVFTLLVRFALLPLTLRQQRSSMKMQAIQPQIQAIQKKYRDNPQKMQEEFQKIGYNPADTLMGCLPLVLQFPIFIGLYRAIIVMLGATPQSVYNLTQQVYPAVASFVDLSNLLPVANRWLWLNMAQPDPLFVLPVLVGGTMFLSQKLMMPATQPADKNKKGASDNPMASMTQTMTYTMPLMFGFFSLSFPAGLSVYFVLSNLVGVAQGFIIRRSRENLADTVPQPVSVVDAEAIAEEAQSQAANKNNQKKKSESRKSNGRQSDKQSGGKLDSNGKKTYSKRKRRSAKR